jgi:predicted DNA-binding transcriptional regulator AlpA
MVECGYLRVGDVADLLGVSRQRADQVRHRQDFPTSIGVLGRRLWRRSDVERWAKRQGGGERFLNLLGWTEGPRLGVNVGEF